MWVKKTLFNPLTGWFFRALGGAPIVRHANEKQVDAIARLYENRTVFRMLLAPEGTRGKVSTGRRAFITLPKRQMYLCLCCPLILKIK